MTLANSDGGRARVKSAKSPYSDFRRTVGHGCHVTDLDYAEWREVNGAPTIVAFIETSEYADIPELRPRLPALRATALASFKRRGQYAIVTTVAAALGVPACYVLVREDTAVFFICRLRDERWSRALTAPEYVAWIRAMRAPRGTPAAPADVARGRQQGVGAPSLLPLTSSPH